MTTSGPSRDDAVPGGAADGMSDWPTGRLLSTAARLVEHAWVEVLDELGLTHAGLIVLHLLGEGPFSQRDLARRARVETQTMSRTLDRLEREGYVIRARDPRDARRHLITRTDAGAAAWEAARARETNLFPPLSQHDALRKALLEIIDAVTAKRWSGR
jgi:MarR family transcriptional regulator, organic hydroperoxide resistance regulator